MTRFFLNILRNASHIFQWTHNDISWQHEFQSWQGYNFVLLVVGTMETILSGIGVDSLKQWWMGNVWSWNYFLNLVWTGFVFAPYNAYVTLILHCTMIQLVGIKTKEKPIQYSTHNIKQLKQIVLQIAIYMIININQYSLSSNFHPEIDYSYEWKRHKSSI